MIPPLPPDRRPGCYDLDAASDEAAYLETYPSLTVQSQTEDSDINVMMKRFGLGAPMPTDARLPRYGDFTHLTDFRSALEAIHAAEDAFLEFPPEIRLQFQNNPQLFLDFVENPANINTVKQWFPKENLNVSEVTSGGAAAPQSSSSSSSGGAGAPVSDGGAGVPK